MKLPKPDKKLPKSANLKNNRPRESWAAVYGAISKWNLTMLFAIPGVLVLLLTILDGIPPGPERFQREPHSRAGGRVISEKDWEFFA